MLLKVKEVAEKLNVTPQFVYNMISPKKTPKDKLWPYIRVGKAIRFDYDELIAHIKKIGKN